MIAAIMIIVMLELVGRFADNTGVAKDTDQLSKLVNDVRSKCSGITGEGADAEGSRSLKIDISKGDEVKVTGDRESLQINFPEEEARTLSLPDGCSIDFVSGEGNTLGNGLHKLNITGDGSASPPKVIVEKTG